MAVLASNQVLRCWSEGTADRIALYALRNCTAGDTADLAAEFTLLKRAVMLATTISGAASATVAGTNVTVPAGLAGDAGYVLVWGCAGGA